MSKFNATRTRPAKSSHRMQRRRPCSNFAWRSSRWISVAMSANLTAANSPFAQPAPAAICRSRAGRIATPTPAKDRLIRRACLRLSTLFVMRTRRGRLPHSSTNGFRGELTTEFCVSGLPFVPELHKPRCRISRWQARGARSGRPDPSHRGAHGTTAPYSRRLSRQYGQVATSGQLDAGPVQRICAAKYVWH
jgi:hypothetical protein